MKFAALIFMALSLNVNTYSREILFSDDFLSGELESNWILYGDPQPGILDTLGIPPPCFINNGDAMYGSGVVSREVFRIAEGLKVECDMYLECAERGTWVTALISFVTSEYRDDMTLIDYQIAFIDYSYSGELDWGCPHRQGVLSFVCKQNDGITLIIEEYHQNKYLNGWYTYGLEITEDRRILYYIDDSLCCTSTVSIPDTVEHVRIQLGNRSSDWGIALHDNLVVYRP